ncbi:hypothetical protein [Verrucosispora sp. TAA-831]|uniref:hypothetical protein n=1 Tax=Verrucosispora sp. TAA-831 TaxID=3422227 RepID=UPI003D6DC8C8
MTTTSEPELHPGLTTLSIEWTVWVDLPDGRHDLVACDSLTQAITKARIINQEQPGTARIQYRDVETWPWTDDLGGDEFGVQYTWPDGRSEVEPRRSREDAESSGRWRTEPGDPTQQVVSRRVLHGAWQPFAAASCQPQPRKQPQHWTWWLKGGGLVLALLLLAMGITAKTLGVALPVRAAIGTAFTIAVAWHLVSKVRQHYR